MTELNFKFIASFVDKLSAPSRSVLGNFSKGVKKRRDDLDRSLQTAGNLSHIGQASSAMGKKIVDSFMSPIQTAGMFEEAMSTVKAITGSTRNEFNVLTKTARNLGETTSFSASEAAQGMRFLGMAGFDANQIVKSMPGVLNLAKAGATDLGRAADISSDILTGFGLSANDMGRVGDVLSKTFTSSNTTLEMLGDTMKYVGPLSKKAGVDLETMAAMTGLLGNAGIKGSQAGTTLRAMLTRLTAPSNQASEALASLGVDIEDMNGNMRPILDIIGDLTNGMQGMGDVEQLSILKEVFGEEPASGMAELLSQGKEGIAAYVQQLKNADGTANRIAKTMSDNSRGGVKEFDSAMESLKITIGTELLPEFTELVRGATKVVRKFSGWASQNQDTVKTIANIGFAVGGFLAVTGPLSSLLSGLVGGTGLLKFGLTTLSSVGLLPAKLAFSSVISVVKALGFVLGKSPLGLVITGIALGAGLIIANWGKVKEFFVGLWDTIKTTFNGIYKWIKKALLDPIGTLKSVLGGAWKYVVGAEFNPKASNIDTTRISSEVRQPLAASTTTTHTTKIEMHQTINPAPNMDEEQLARRAAKKIEENLLKAQGRSDD